MLLEVEVDEPSVSLSSYCVFVTGGRCAGILKCIVSGSCDASKTMGCSLWPFYTISAAVISGVGLGGAFVVVCFEVVDFKSLIVDRIFVVEGLVIVA